jgi:uncharacterized membrane protein
MLQNLSFKFLLPLLLFFPAMAGAQAVHQDFQERVPAEVLEIVAEYEREITGTESTVVVQEVRAILKGGQREGEVVRFDSEQVTLKPGDKIYVNRMVTINGDEFIMYADFERRSILFVIFALFIFLLLMFSGWQGVRALVSLAGSIGAIFFLLVPALLAGWNPVVASVGISAAILAMVFFGTHGIKPRSVIAFMGTFSAVVLTGLIALISSNFMRLTGFSSDASVYLNFATKGSLDLSGLLLGSIIIGILGVLDDVSITQASVVEQLKRANASLRFKELYQRASTVGRDHIGSLVNTLALAYVGVSLPLILLYSKANSSFWETLNQEVVAAELLRIIVGSIGLILAVPATTAVAAWYFHQRTVDEVDNPLHDEHHHHHHNH